MLFSVSCGWFFDIDTMSICVPVCVHLCVLQDNILLSVDGVAKISDFGLARCKYESYVKTARRGQ